MAKIDVFQFDRAPVEEQPVEFVERKGKGHPDSLMDGIAERASLELSRYYIDNFGAVLHHNVDKGLIVGGRSETGFGSARITEPIQVIIAGRATDSHQGKTIPVDEIATDAAKSYLKENTRFLDVENEVRILTRIRRGSADLTNIFGRSSDVLLANDTSAGVGYAPLTKTEILTLEAEKFLNGAEYKKKMPMTGEDIKVFSVRRGSEINMTVAVAFVAHLVKSIEEYISYKNVVALDLQGFAEKLLGDGEGERIDVAVNTGDSHENREVYLTKTGLSCEAGDDGQVGRGNRVNGLITPSRPMTLEAAAGKNPATHTGKLYSVIANEIAIDVVKLYPQVRECGVQIASQIGRKLDDPYNLSVSVIMKKGEKLDPIKGKIHDIAEDMITNVNWVSRQLAEGRYSVF